MKYSLKRFLQNIIYLAKYNLKEIDRDSKAYIIIDVISLLNLEMK